MIIKHLKTILSFSIVGAFLFLAFGSGGSKSDSSKNENEVSSLVINDNSATFTYEVGFMYTLAYCGLASDIWWVLNQNQNITELEINVVEECEDKFGNKDKKTTVLHIDQGWIESNEVRKYNDEDKFCNYANDNSIFMDMWVPRGNYCD